MSERHEITGADLKATAPDRTRPAFEHARLTDPTIPLSAIAEESFERVLECAANWAAIQGSDQIRLPHLFAALLGDGTAARWDALRKQTDVESLKQRVLLMVPPHKSPQVAPEEMSASDSVRRVLDSAKRRAADQARTVGVDDVFRAFLAEPGIVGEQLTKWGVKL